METIVKYSNRKLYSKELSKYVTLSYVIDLVKTKSNFTILDNSTKQDITGTVLAECVTILDSSRSSLENFIRSN